MAKVISDEILKLKVVINGDEAQKRVLDLELANKKLQDSLKELNTEHKSLESQRKKEEIGINSLANQIDKFKGKLHENQSVQIETIKTLKKQQSAYKESSLEYQSLQSKIEKTRVKAISGNKELEEKISSLVSKQNKLKLSYDETSSKVTEFKKKIESTKKELSYNTQEIDEETKSMNIMSLTTSQLQKRITDLSFTMKHMDPNSSAYKDAGDEMNRLTGRMKELKTGTSQSAFSLQHLSDKFNQYSGIATAAIATLAGVAFSIQGVIDANNKLVDAQTAVSKTTGLSTEEVKELTRAYSEFDTRTKRIDLLKISEIGGRLGVPKEEIKDFTREVDKAYVALGDSFSGGVEAVANKLGKIKGLFKETRDLSVADAINEVGSALNELGAAGAASEENMSDFALRVGQLPESLKPTIAETLALGAAFEESGITSERASSGYGKFVRVAANQTAEFAKVMGITKKEVKDLINQDPLQFFLKFAQGAKGLDATKLSEVLDGLKLNDAEVISVIGAASENTDRFTKSIELSNQALGEATSLQKEFDKVNNNSAAIYEKVQKKFVGMFTSETVAKTLNWFIEMFGRLLGVTVEGEEKLSGFNATLLFLVRTIGFVVVGFTSVSVAMAMYNALIKESILKNIALEAIEKARDLRMKLSASFQALYNGALGIGATITAKMAAAIGLQTLATNAQDVAQKRLNATTAANPFLALVTVIMLVVAAYKTWKSHIESLREAEKKQYEEAHRYQTDQLMIMQKGKQAVEEYKSGISNLIAVLKDENSSQEMRKKAYESLIKIHPEFMGTVDNEFRATAKLASVYQELAKQIDLSARMKARSAAKQSVYDDNAKLELEYMKGAQARQKEQEQRNKLRSDYNYSKDRANSAVNMFGSFEEHNKGVEILNQIKKNSSLINQYNKADQNRIKELQRLIKTAEGAQKKLYEQELLALIGAGEESKPSTSNYKPLGGKSDKNNTGKSGKNNYDKELSEYEKSRQKLLEASANHNQKMEEYEADRLRALSDLQKDSYEKERQLAIAEEAKNVADLEKKKYSSKEFDQLRSMIAKEKGEMRKKLQEIEFQWLEENGRLSNLQEIEADKLNLKLLTINEKYLSKAFEQEQKAFEKKQRLIDRESNEKQSLDINGQKAFLAEQGYTPETLADIRTWEESRAAIEKFYQEKRLRDQLENLRAMVAQMSVIQSQGLIDLTPEQLEQIEVMKDKIASLVAELAKLKNSDTGGDKLGGKLSGFGGSTDILGLSPDQWEAMFTNTDKLSENIQKVGAALQVAKNMMGMYSQFAQANEERLLQQYETASQRKTTLLDKQLKAGLITQEQYKKQTIANEKQLEKQKALLAYKSAKRQRAMQVAETVANTAMSIMGIWAQFPKFDFGATAAIMSGVVGALGAVQLATIMSQPLPEVPGAEDGFYPVIRKQDNKLFQARKRRTSTGFYDEPTMLVGEQGAAYPELVVTQKTARQIDPDVSNAYMREIARIEGYQDGYYKNVKPSQSSSTSSGDEIMIKLISTIDSFNQTMQEIKTNGLETYIKDSLDNGAKIDKMVKGSQDLYNKNKHG